MPKLLGQCALPIAIEKAYVELDFRLRASGFGPRSGLGLMGFDFRAQAFDYKAFGLGNIKKIIFVQPLSLKPCRLCENIEAQA